jgi:hypothetical protein
VSAGRFLLGTDSDRRAGFGGAAPSPPPLQPGDLPLPMPTAVTLGVSLPKERTGTSFLWCLSEALAIRDKPESSMAYNCRSAVALSLTLSLVLRFRQSLLRNDRPLPDTPSSLCCCTSRQRSGLRFFSQKIESVTFGAAPRHRSIGDVAQRLHGWLAFPPPLLTPLVRNYPAIFSLDNSVGFQVARPRTFPPPRRFGTGFGA